ncbi:HpcH/HpaI aldolase family protein [Rhodococcus erythropolis]|uniref:Aldolase/citrate lyase family protein n=1 Tax=Rhodococcus erythropolis TaxID=1833 RepID=A0AAX3ZYZ1_RHOER|nr:aldolase/citrate lyase family protein [Rhodococcus erythropolis]WMN01749.1 aldolase/citrate lyase family protein [Rhodococcus erythropolis]
MRITTRNIRSKIEAGQRAYGSTVQFPYPEIVEIVGYTGFDYVWIDAEHGTMDLSQIAELIRAADASRVDSIVRVPDHDASFIGRVLDAGATGIMVPHVDSVAVAEKVVAAAKFSPLGTRGACPSVRWLGHLSEDWNAEYRRADQDTLVFALIEDVAGVENAERIAEVQGLDGLVFGPFDLAMALGHDGEIHHPEVVAMHDRVVGAANAAGIEYVSASAAWEPGGSQGLIDSGSRVVNVTGDRGLLAFAHRQALAAIQQELSDVGSVSASAGAN